MRQRTLRSALQRKPALSNANGARFVTWKGSRLLLPPVIFRCFVMSMSASKSSMSRRSVSMTVLHKEALKEAEQAQRQLRRKLEKPVTESEVHDALSTLSDPDDADQRADEALVTKVNAENERDREQDKLAKAEQEMQGFKKRLSGQGIDENELEDVLESEALCIKEAEEEERLAANNEQVAQKQSTTELEAQQSAQNCATHIESLVRVQRQVEMMQENHGRRLGCRVFLDGSLAEILFLPEIMTEDGITSMMALILPLLS